MLENEVKNKLARLEEMRNDELLPAPPESDGSQHSASASDKMVNAIIRRLGYEDKIIPQIKRTAERLEFIRECVESVSQTAERQVLTLRYIETRNCELTPWKDVAMKIYSKDDESRVQSLKRIHNSALETVRKISMKKAAQK